MKAVLAVLACSLLCSTLVLAQSAPDMDAARMTAEERAKAIKLLNDSHKEFIAAIEKLTDAQWNYKPSPFKWSAGEIAEHIMLTEGLLFSVVQRVLASKPNPDWESKTAGKDKLIERILPARAGRAQAPLEVRPTGKMTRDEVIKRFKEGRVKIMDFAEHTSLPLKAHTADHPIPVFGTLNGYDWFLYVPYHTMRHLKQMAELKADAGFPK